MSAEFTQDHIEWGPWLPAKDACKRTGYGESWLKNLVDGKAKQTGGWIAERRAVQPDEDFGRCQFVYRLANIYQQQQEINRAEPTSPAPMAEAEALPLLARAGLPMPVIEIAEETWRQRCVVLMEVIGEARGIGKNSEEWRELWNLLYRRARVRFGIDFKARAKQSNAASTLAYVESIEMCESLYALACEVFASTLAGEGVAKQ